MATLLWTACQKETLPEPGASSQVQENLTPRIADFVARAQHQASVQGGSRSTNEFNADSAAWYVEGALNYSLAKAWLPYNELVHDSITVAIPGTAASVSQADAENTFVGLLGQLQQAVQGGDKHLVVVDAEPQTTASGLELKVRYTVGQGHERLGLNTTYAANTQLWFMTGMGSTGSCDPNFYSLKAADKTIQDRVAATIPLLAVGQYYASVETWWVRAGNTDLQSHQYSITAFPGATTTGYKIFYTTSNFLLCINASQMSLYTQGAFDVMNWVNLQNCPTKVPASVRIDGQIVWDYTLYIHEVQFQYGKPQYGINH